MSTKERVFHMVLFEAIALILLTLTAVLVTGNGALKMGGLAVALSLIAMGWNYLYNLVFDKVYGSNRIERTLSTRIWHGAGFELGMLVFSFPVIMWWLQLDFLKVLIMDFGAAVFFLLYAIAFNWIYDIARHRMSQQKVG
ncbi:MAG: PACE efflux transporter [Halioglobus sp.]